MQQILASHELKPHSNFWPGPPKNQFLPSVHSSDTVNFRVSSPDWPFPFSTMLNPKMFNYLLICVNLCQLASSSLEKQSFSESRDQIGKTHFDNAQPRKIFNQLLIFANLYQHVKNYNLCWRNGWFKSPGIWLAETVLAYISGTRFFPNIGFVQELSK